MSGRIMNLAVNPSPKRMAITGPWISRGLSLFHLIIQRTRAVMRSVMATVVLSSPKRIMGTKGRR